MHETFNGHSLGFVDDVACSLLRLRILFSLDVRGQDLRSKTNQVCEVWMIDVEKWYPEIARTR